MRISDVLRGKGDAVVTIGPDETVQRLLECLAEHHVGALVVSEDGRRVAGIVSERDIVRHLHSQGAQLLKSPVRGIMTSQVHMCDPHTAVDDLMVMMTDRRVRHVPVLVDGELAGIVSIGDVVKHRIGELQSERDHLAAYIQS